MPEINPSKIMIPQLDKRGNFTVPPTTLGLLGDTLQLTKPEIKLLQAQLVNAGIGNRADRLNEEELEAQRERIGYSIAEVLDGIVLRFDTLPETWRESIFGDNAIAAMRLEYREARGEVQQLR